MSRKHATGDPARRSRSSVRFDVDDPQYERAVFAAEDAPEGLPPQQVISRGNRRGGGRFGRMPRVKGKTHARKMTSEELAEFSSDGDPLLRARYGLSRGK